MAEVNIIIRIKDKEIKLSLEEASELNEQLNKIFRKDKEYIPTPICPDPYPIYPNIQYFTSDNRI